jgi:hypothetical protein
MAVSEGAAPLAGSRFALGREVANGFYTFLDAARGKTVGLVALKGQITGPITFCTGLADECGRAIYYNDQLRDMAVKHLALKARYQVAAMAAICPQTLLFFDEPGLAGLGSSAMITVSTADILAAFAEVFAAVRAEGGLTGIHVCANTEWPVIFASGVDIVSYDAYSYFDRLVLYAAELREFFARGGMLASGIVPTAPDLIDDATAEDLVARWCAQTDQLVRLGIDRQTVIRQSFITPSCGTGAVSRAQAEKVLALTGAVSAQIRAAA